MPTTSVRFSSPLSLAIGLIGYATIRHLSGALDRYADCHQRLTLMDPQSGEQAEVHIERAADAARAFRIVIGPVTASTLRTRVRHLVRAFVRETQAPVTVLLARRAATSSR